MTHVAKRVGRGGISLLLSGLVVLETTASPNPTLHCRRYGLCVCLISCVRHVCDSAPSSSSAYSSHLPLRSPPARSPKHNPLSSSRLSASTCPLPAYPGELDGFTAPVYIERAVHFWEAETRVCRPPRRASSNRLSGPVHTLGATGSDRPADGATDRPLRSRLDPFISRSAYGRQRGHFPVPLDRLR